MTSRKKIVMIGPVYPYKGGISHYTGLLYQSLVQKHDVFPNSHYGIHIMRHDHCRTFIFLR